MTRVKNICDEIINYLATQGITATYSITPWYDTEIGGFQTFVTPLSSEIARTARDGVAYNLTIQILVCKAVDGHSDADIQTTIDNIEDLKENMIGAIISVDDNEWLVDNVANSGTQFLSSSELRGGLVDSRELEEYYVLQTPVLMNLRRN